jgi:lactose/L-arabinose transport system substrate-binding protein
MRITLWHWHSAWRGEVVRGETESGVELRAGYAYTVFGPIYWTKGYISVTQMHDAPDTTPVDSTPTTLDHTISRAAMLKGTAAAAGALLAAPVASALAGPSKMAAPAVLRAPSGTITIWDRAGDLFQVFDSTIASFNKKYPGIAVKHVSVDVDAKLPTTLETGVNVPDGSFYEDVNIPIQAAHLYDISEWIAPYTKNIVPIKLRVVSQGKHVLGIP